MTEKILMAAVARAKSGNKEQCRAKFEAWARSQGHKAILYGIGDDVEYDMPEHYLFAGWCAAWNRAAQPVVLTDEQIIAAFEPHIDSDPTASHEMPTYWVRQDELIAFTRAILAAKEQA